MKTNGLELRNERALIVEGAGSNAYLLLTQGAMFTAIALFFRLDAWWLGVSAAFPMVFQLFQVFAPPLVERSRHRPGLLNLFNALRFVWLVPVGAALAGYRGAALFIACFALSQAANALAGNVWLVLCRDLVGHGRRGAFFGRRNAILGALTVSLLPIYAWLMDALAEPWNVAAIVGLGLLGTVVAIAAAARLTDPEHGKYSAPAAPPPKLRDFLRSTLEPAGDPAFRKLALAFVAWNFAIQLTAPFFSYHQVRHLGMSYTLQGLTVTVASLGVMVFYRLWGKVADRVGHKSVLMAGLAVTSAIPALWLFMGEPLWPLLTVVDVAVTGVGWAAVNLSLLTFPLEAAGSDKGASRFLALLNAAGGLGGLAGSLAGGAMASAIAELRWTFLGVEIWGLQAMFGLDSILRLGAALLFARVKAARYIRPVTLVANLLAVVARRAPLRPAELDLENGDPDS